MALNANWTAFVYWCLKQAKIRTLRSGPYGSHNAIVMDWRKYGECVDQAYFLTNAVIFTISSQSLTADILLKTQFFPEHSI